MRNVKILKKIVTFDVIEDFNMYNLSNKFKFVMDGGVVNLALECYCDGSINRLILGVCVYYRIIVYPATSSIQNARYHGEILIKDWKKEA
jgi:hypothetical protein